MSCGTIVTCSSLTLKKHCLHHQNNPPLLYVQSPTNPQFGRSQGSPVLDPSAPDLPLSIPSPTALRSSQAKHILVSRHLIRWLCCLGPLVGNTSRHMPELVTPEALGMACIGRTLGAGRKGLPRVPSPRCNRNEPRGSSSTYATNSLLCGPTTADRATADTKLSMFPWSAIVASRWSPAATP
jgi:hypothetical protein